MKYYTHILNNGIRLVHQPSKSHVAHCGFIINTGTRDEDSNEAGVAHLVEHMLFKGTSKRKAYHVLSRIEDVGGEIDAYTTKEETCIYASFLPDYYERSIELLDDIIFNSTFLAKELEKEKEVVCEEINSYLDSPAEWIFDEFEAMMYENHPLGHNILGTTKSVRSFDAKKVASFVQEHYHTDQMVFTSIGNIPFEKLVYLLEKYSGNRMPSYRMNKRKLWKGKSVFNSTQIKNNYQSHCIIGAHAYGYRSDKRFPLILLSNLLAGTGLNSRLNLLLREKYGLAYNIESSYTTFNETGNFNIYFGTDKENIPKAMHLIRKEMDLLMQKPLGPMQLSKAKKQLIGQMAIGAEIQINLLLSVGKSYLLYDHIESLDETYRKIDSISAKDIIEIANDIFDEKGISSLIFK